MCCYHARESHHEYRFSRIMSKLTYFKRFRMEVDLRRELPAARLPPEFDWLEWDDLLLDVHAEVKYLCFNQEIDALVFPSLSHLDGCRELMAAIRHRAGFCSGATWLIAGVDGCIGTVQGVIDADGFGAIQNLGVVAEFRGRGLGPGHAFESPSRFSEGGRPQIFPGSHGFQR